MLGSARDHDVQHAALIDETSVAVVSVDYRLAPEHRWPAAHNDSEDAAAWPIENAVREFGTEKVFIGGQSAGANLALAALLHLRDSSGYTGWVGANLVYGSYNLRIRAPDRLPTVDPILDPSHIDWFHEQLLTGTSQAIDRSHPDLAPISAPLHSLPPALFTIGTHDPLWEENVTMAKRWVDAGNEAELAEYVGGIHGLDQFRIQQGTLANQRIYDWFNERLATPG